MIFLLRFHIHSRIHLCSHQWRINLLLIDYRVPKASELRRTNKPSLQHDLSWDGWNEKVPRKKYTEFTYRIFTFIFPVTWHLIVFVKVTESISIIKNQTDCFVLHLFIWIIYSILSMIKENAVISSVNWKYQRIIFSTHWSVILSFFCWETYSSM